MNTAALSITQHLAEAREFAQRLLGDRYATEIKPWRQCIRHLQREHHGSVAQACHRLIEMVDQCGSVGDMLRAQAACWEEMSGEQDAREVTNG